MQWSHAWSEMKLFILWKYLCRKCRQHLFLKNKNLNKLERMKLFLIWRNETSLKVKEETETSGERPARWHPAALKREVLAPAVKLFALKPSQYDSPVRCRTLIHIHAATGAPEIWGVRLSLTWRQPLSLWSASGRIVVERQKSDSSSWQVTRMNSKAAWCAEKQSRAQISLAAW